MYQTENQVLNTAYATPFYKKLPWKIVGISVLGLCVLIGALIYVSLQSLPGETLYSLKTNGFERIAEKTHIYSKDKAWYQVTLMKNRLKEAKKLSEQSTVSEEALTDLTTQINGESAELNRIVAEAIDSAFSKTDMLYTLNEFTSIAGAIEAIGENDEKLQTLGDAAEEVRQTTNQIYKERVKSFVQTETPQTALAYIQEELMRVKNELGNTNLSKKTVRIAGNYFDRVEPALVKSDYYKTILSIGEAYRVVTIEKYAGITIDETQETKQNTATSTPENTATTSLQSTTTVPQ